MAPLCIDSCYPPAWSIMRDFYIDFIFILDIYVYLKNIVNTVNLDISHTQTILPRPDGFGYYLILLNSQNTRAPGSSQLLAL